jgi:dephospho-CoA kinase
MKIVVINGPAGAGKDLFVTFCAQFLGTDKIKNYSTVDYVKAIAAQIGWDGTKDLKNRKFLSDLKDVLTEWDDIPYRRTKIEITEFQDKLNALGEEYDTNGVMFIHCREPEEIARFKAEYGAQTVLVRRESAENQEVSNHADERVFEYKYDTVVYNNGTIEDLREGAHTYLREVLKLDV